MLFRIVPSVILFSLVSMFQGSTEVAPKPDFGCYNVPPTDSACYYKQQSKVSLDLIAVQYERKFKDKEL